MMKLNLRLDWIHKPLLGGLCAALLASACGGGHRDIVGAILEALKGGRGSGGSHGAGGSGGPMAANCVLDADQIFGLIASDVSQLDTDDRLFVRYLSLANRSRVIGCGRQ